MKTYRGVVIAKYYQEIEVEANSEDDAEMKMCELFNMDRADCEMDVYDVEEV